MKISLRKRIIAFTLSVILLFSGSISGFASELLESEQVTETAAVVSEEVTEPVTEVTEVTTEAATEATEAVVAMLSEEVTETDEEVTEAATEEVTEAATEAVTEEATEAAAKEETVEETEEEIVEETETETVEETEEETEESEEETEEVVQVLEYEDNDVKIHVEAVGADAIPEGASLKVSPITSDDAEYNEVEQQLNEKAEGEEYEIAGFLAYDITFVDKDGNKVEPNGNVIVTIDYKQATLPEAVNAEEFNELDVTVMHFEEDASGEVKDVVDMVAEANIDAQVTTTENAEVQKAEFITDSFSVYTVTWTYNGYTVSLKMHYGYLNDSGEFTEFTDQPTKTLDNITANQNNTTVNLTEYNNNGVFGTGDYTYDKAYIVKGDAPYSNAISATQLRLHYSTNLKGVRLQYSNSNNNNTELFNVTSSTAESDKICSIYYVYKAPPQPIATVNSNAANINIHVHDYSVWSSEDKSENHNVLYEVNSGKDLQFAENGTQYSDYNRWTNGNGTSENIVQSNLSSEYPVMNKGSKQSLSYLFSGGYSANYLFQKIDGYYVYDSAKNFAKLNIEENRFEVYSGPNQGFFPFNNYTDELILKDAEQNKTTNHHFGMNIDFTFMQPANGLLDQNNLNSHMKFEFSGDDDVWVFIDGMLVLDLGGIHGVTGGVIDFATGKVTYTGEDSGRQETTILKMFTEALTDKYGAGSEEINKELEKYFEKNDKNELTSKFKSYSQHKLNFFYLERGADKSNCMIKFNLISIPENKISIEKEITKSNMADFADVEFTFKIEKKDVGTDGQYPTNSTLLAEESYALYEVDGYGNRTFIGMRQTDANGQFKLKHRQVAEFSNIRASTKYCVTEVGVSTDVYDKVSFNGTVIEIKDDTLTDQFSTGELLAQNYVYVKFQNQCNVDNLRNLIIEKRMATGQTSTDYFDIKLEFKEVEKVNGEEVVKWIPYVGKYYLNENQIEKATTNGIIKLQPNDFACIKGLISGTEYRVSEVLSEAQQLNYGTPVYTGTGIEATQQTPITGRIELEKVDKVTEYKATVTNTLLMKVNVNKEWEDTETTHEAVYVGLYTKRNNEWVPYSDVSYKMLTNEAWSTTFESLNGGEYDVKELVPGSKQNGKSDFTIEGEGYIAVEANGLCTNGEYDYSVSYSKVPDIDNNIINVTIKNTRLGKIIIEKVSKSNKDFKLEGAEFKLQKYDAKTNSYEGFGQVKTTDSNGNVIFDNLALGTYKIIEVKAPTGYMLSDEEVIVVLPKTTNSVVSYETIVTIENEALYALPSSGGFGIYWYMVAGVAMMILATAIQYKNRRKEVLERIDKR